MRYAMRHATVAAVAAGLVIVAAAGPARAGGFEYGTDNGAEAVARAGASTAYANPMSLYTNIAGIADIPRYVVFLSDNIIFQRVTFERTPYLYQYRDGWDPVVAEYGYEPTEDTTGAFWLGASLAAHVRLTDYLVLSLGAMGPAAVGQANFAEPDPARWVNEPDDGGGLPESRWLHNPAGSARFDLTAMSVVFVWPTIGLGLTVPHFERLRIGVAFQPGFVHMAMTTYADAYDINGEVRTELSVWDPFVPAGEIGFLLRLWRFDIGAQVRLSDDIEATGHVVDSRGREDYAEFFDVDPDPASPTTVEVRDATAGGANFSTPWPLAVLRVGVRYAHPRAGVDQGCEILRGARRCDDRMPWQRDLFDVEVDFVYENTSRVDAYDVSLTDLNLEGVAVPSRSLSVPHNWTDSFGVRLGGSAHFLDGMLTASLGVSWDSGAVPLEWTRLDYLGWQRFGLGLGLTFRYSLIELTVAYQHMFIEDRDVTLPERADPRSDQYDPEYDVCQDRPCGLGAMNDYTFSVDDINRHSEGWAANTGHYEASQDILSISLAFRWGQGSGGLRDRSREEQAEPVEAEPAEEVAPATAEPPPAPTTPEPAPADAPGAAAPDELSAPTQPPEPQPAPVE